MQSTSFLLSSCFYCAFGAGHVTPKSVRSFIEQNRQMTRQRFATGVRDQSRKRVLVNERIDRLSIFDAIEWRNVHQKEVTSDKWPVTSKELVV